MDYTKIGFLTASRLGLGGCPLGGHGWGDPNDDLAREAIRTALEAGITFFDTADVYGLGHSESLLAETLGSERMNVCLASKGGVRWDANGKCTKDISPDYIRSALAASLKRLKLDSLPLYYLHWPDEKTPIEKAVEELARCREEGLIQEIGLSNFTSGEIERARSVAPIAAVQVQCSLVDQESLHRLRETVKKNEIALVTWGSLAQGLLSGKYNERSCFADNDRRSRESYVNFHGSKFMENMKVVRLLQEFAQEMEKTPAQIAIRWLLDTSPISSVLFGAKNPQQVIDNIGAIGWSLDEDKKEKLTELGQNASCL